MKKNKEFKEKYKIFDSKLDTELKKWISAKAREIEDLYGIGRINLCFNEKKEEFNKHNSSLVIFSIHYAKIYKTVNLTLYDITKQLWEQNNKDFLFHSLIHEFAHVLTTSLADAALARHISKKEIVDRIEELTESIATLARELYNLKNK